MDRIIREKELERILRVSKTIIWRLERNGALPKHSNKCGVMVWGVDQISSWMANGGIS